MSKHQSRIHRVCVGLTRFAILWLVGYGYALGAPNTKTDFNLKKGQLPRSSVWTTGLSALRHSLKASDDNEFVGKGGEVSLGLGYIAHAWYTMGTLDIYLGPYEPTLSDQFNVDYSGTGLTWWWGYSAQSLDLRSSEGSYGFAFGLSYADIVGRSVGANRRQPADPSDPQGDGLVSNYSLRVNSLAFIPGIFFSWLTEARPRGNSPELLMTRLEGFFLTMGVAMPIATTYVAKFDRRIAPATEAESPINQPESESGQLRGYTILVNLSAMLGT